MMKDSKIVYQLYLDDKLYIRFRDYYKHERTAKAAVTSYSEHLAREQLKKQNIDRSNPKEFLDTMWTLKAEIKKRFTIVPVELEEAIIKIGNTRKIIITGIANKIIANKNNPLLVEQLAKNIVEELGGE